jgi:rare lipoprotein A
MRKSRTGRRWTFLVVAALAVSACAETEFLVHSAKRVGNVFEAPQEPTYKVGEPYQIQGTWYYPGEDFQYDETGIASWYGAQFHGRRTANGETYDMNSLTAAHRTLPMPSYVRVTNLENGRSLILKVNDRGPFARGRIIDISRRGAQLLGFHDNGTARVRVQIMADQSRAIAARLQTKTQLAEAGTPITVDRLPKPDVKTENLAPPPGGASAPVVRPTPAPQPVATPPDEKTAAKRNDNEVLSDNVTVTPVKKTSLFVQAGAFTQFENANRVRAKLSPMGPVTVASVLVNGKDFYRVRVGPLQSVTDADRMLEAVSRAGYPDARIVVD